MSLIKRILWYFKPFKNHRSKYINYSPLSKTCR